MREDCNCLGSRGNSAASATELVDGIDGLSFVLAETSCTSYSTPDSTVDTVAPDEARGARTGYDVMYYRYYTYLVAV